MIHSMFLSLYSIQVLSACRTLFVHLVCSLSNAMSNALLVLGDERAELLLASALKLLYHSAILEQLKGRHAGDATHLRCLGVLVHIYLHQHSLVAKLVCHGGEHRGYPLTRWAHEAVKSTTTSLSPASD